MSPAKRLRRTALLCLHCLANFAHFRAMREAINTGDIVPVDFNRRITNNFLDVGLLEWCKLFADHDGKHHWRKVVAGTDMQRSAWRDNLLAHVAMEGALFRNYVRETKHYRDKFVAHLDDDETMLIPDLTTAIQSGQFLYQRLVDHEAPALGNPMPGAPPSATGFYQDQLGKGQAAVAAMRAI